MVEAQGLPGIPEAPFCPLPQVTGVEAVRPMVWGGGCPAASATQATATLGFHLANKCWLWD